ncbi:hypothetical protein NDU88_001407, partial [Pleurodeles waltl]
MGGYLSAPPPRKASAFIDAAAAVGALGTLAPALTPGLDFGSVGCLKKEALGSVTRAWDEVTRLGPGG